MLFAAGQHVLRFNAFRRGAFEPRHFAMAFFRPAIPETGSALAGAAWRMGETAVVKAQLHAPVFGWRSSFATAVSAGRGCGRAGICIIMPVRLETIGSRVSPQGGTSCSPHQKVPPPVVLPSVSGNRSSRYESDLIRWSGLTSAATRRLAHQENQVCNGSSAASPHQRPSHQRPGVCRCDYHCPDCANLN
jgi:hypothetical protein